MEENQNAPKIRKLRKIKRSRPQNQPMSFGAPTKVNYSQPSSFLEDAFNETADNNTVYDNNGDAENIHFITEEELMPQAQDSIAVLLRNKTVFMLLIIAGLIGAITGYILAPASSGSSASRGLDGVVVNPDLPQGRSRCGVAEPHQGCVLYMMNPKNREVLAKDFYKSAATWTGRQPYLIDTSNMKYSSMKIKPGYIAQINIPPL